MMKNLMLNTKSKMPNRLIVIMFTLIGMFGLLVSVFAQTDSEDLSLLLKDSHESVPVVRNNIAPQLGCWFVKDKEVFEENGYKEYFDAVASRNCFDLFSTSTRYDLEVTDAWFHDMIKKAAIGAEKNYRVGLLLDLDIRLARRAFAKKYPDALQEKLLFVEKSAATEGITELLFQMHQLKDHYTGGSVPYLVLGNRFIKMWSYEKNEQKEILPDSIREITADVTATSKNKEQMILQIPAIKNTLNRSVCGVVAFRYLSPDVFAPELIAFEKEILQQYADVPLKGTCKDEWGFPPPVPRIDPSKKQYWYSEATQQNYAQKYPGRVLVDDCFLMAFPQKGKESERQTVIDQYNRLCFEKNVEVEIEYTKTTKEIFGQHAFLATHPTWWPWPNSSEFTKNQLFWWKVPRDYAQTDECTPYFCRTSLAKGTDTVWYNMFYHSDVAMYVAEHWGAVLAAGRVNIHPVLPIPEGLSQRQSARMKVILDAGIDKARQRIHLLDYITHSPVDSPVAVVFGHFGTMNWTRPEYDRVGTTAVDLCNLISSYGYLVDLTPSSQSDTNLWSLDTENYFLWRVRF
jgi:hypothetical protein